ncbi:FtsX-like permease family protein [Arcanobacterium haemolyticum]|nr:FtsX-like permease family protein [Arcanobacterium haemolyticum]
MSSLLRANVRAHTRRYVATGVAIAISMAFVLAALAFGQGLNSSISSSISESFRGASVVVDAADRPFGEAELARLESVDGVSEAVPQVQTAFRLTKDAQRSIAIASTLNPDSLYQPPLEAGRLPNNDSEIALSTSDAKLLNVSIGDSVDARSWDDEAAPTSFSVVGIIKSGAFFSMRSSVLTLGAMQKIDPYIAPYRVFVVADAPAVLSATDQDALAGRINSDLGNDEARAAHVVVADQLSRQGMNSAASAAMLLIFPAIAIAVALIVVSTTFKVIVEQRRRELALLRCIGATGKQVRRLLLKETLIVGLTSSLIGVLIGVLIAAGGMSFADLSETFLDAVLSVNVVSALGVLILGTLLTIIAGLAPTRGATKIPPLAALASTDSESTSARKRRTVSTVLSVLALLAGAGILWLGISTVRADPNSPNVNGFLIALLGGIIAFISSVAVMSMLLPVLTRLTGSIGRGVIGRLAARNAVRNPSRTAATGTAVIIGTALVVTMLTGATSLRATLNSEVDARRPFDLTVSGASTNLPENLIDKIAAISGVEDAGAIPAAEGTYSFADGTEVTTTIYSDLNMPRLAHSDIVTAAPGTVIVDSETAQRLSSDTLSLCGPRTCETFTVRTAAWASNGMWMNEADFEKLGGNSASVGLIQVKLSEDADANSVIRDIQNLDSSLVARGAAQERQMYESAINAILLVVTALLGVSVLVALVGLANTLSLSVAERTRENGLLRAMGLTKKQMMQMLAVESLIIAVTAAIVGTLIGLTFGWLGLAALPLDVEKLAFTVPWLQLGGVLTIAIIAALLASVLPGRRAARISPVEALAHE